LRGDVGSRCPYRKVERKPAKNGKSRYQKKVNQGVPHTQTELLGGGKKEGQSTEKKKFLPSGTFPSWMIFTDKEGEKFVQWSNLHLEEKKFGKTKGERRNADTGFPNRGKNLKGGNLGGVGFQTLYPKW